MNIACYIRNKTVLDQLQAILASIGFTSENFQTDTALLRHASREDVDLIIVDLALGMREGEGLFSWLRFRPGEHAPVMILSPARDAETVAYALDAGADDFLARPFEPIELIARIHALLRRGNRKPVGRTIIQLAGFTLNRASSTASYLSQAIQLTPREFSMAWLFFSSPGTYLSRETIGSAIWNANIEIAGRTIEQHAYKLRKKMQLGEERGVLLRTAYGTGYRLQLVRP
jgi:DNA-binding response OmpR family regulator